MEGFFDSASFDGSIGGFDTGPDSEFSASNWKTWKKWGDWRKSKKRDIEEGDLPEPLQEEVREALHLAQQAAFEQARATEERERRDALLKAMEAREAFENAYRQAYGETYIAEIVSELWRKEMRRIERRKRAAILLLH